MTTAVEEAPAVSEPGPAKKPSKGPRSAVVWLLSNYATVLVLIALIVVFSFTASNFLTSRNFESLIIAQAVVGCVSLGALIPLVVGEFDLSIGYNVGFLAMLAAYLGGEGHGTVVILLAVLVAAILVGVFNGLLRVRFKINSFIATLGVGIMLSGATAGLSGGQVLFSGVPSIITKVGQNHVAGIGICVLLTLALGAAVFYFLEHTPTGRRMYATGGSERVAFLAGVRTGRIKLLAFVLGSVCTAFGAMFALGQSGGATPSFGPELLLPAYAAAFLGVTTYRPGYYNVPGTFVAIMLLAVGFNGLSLLGAPTWLQPIFNGAVLLIAVLTARAESRQVQVG